MKNKNGKTLTTFSRLYKLITISKISPDEW